MWILFALSASLFWGLTYVLNEQIYKRISVISSIAITTLITALVMLIIAFSSGALGRDLTTISSSKKLLFLVIAEVVVFILAEIFIAYSIVGKNATLAGLIEISYPIFIAIFAYIIYKQSALNAGTIVGGVLIFLGVFVIYLFNK